MNIIIIMLIHKIYWFFLIYIKVLIVVIIIFSFLNYFNNDLVFRILNSQDKLFSIEDLILASPLHVIKFTKTFYLRFLLWIILLFLSAATRFFQFFLSIFFLILIFFQFIVHFYYKKELKCNFKVKNNMLLGNFLLLLFYQLPYAYSFKLLYFFLKKIFKKEKYKISINLIKKFFLNIIFRLLFGFPIWLLILVNDIFEILCLLKNIRNLAILKERFFLSIRDSLLSDPQGAIPVSAKLRFFFENNTLLFNPRKIDKEVFKKSILRPRSEIRSVKSISPEKKLEKVHPSIITNSSGSKLNIDAVLTHKPMHTQKSFSSLNEESGRKEYAVYNDIQEMFLNSQKNTTTFTATKEKINSLQHKIEIARMLDPDAGCNVQTFKSCREHVEKTGYFYENLKNVSKDKTDVKMLNLAQSKIEEIQKLNLSQSEIDTYRQQFVQATKYNILLDNSDSSDSSCKKSLNVLEKNTTEMALLQESGFIEEMKESENTEVKSYLDKLGDSPSNSGHPGNFN